jgi:hypothetical protein
MQFPFKMRYCESPRKLRDVGLNTIHEVEACCDYKY